MVAVGNKKSSVDVDLRIVAPEDDYIAFTNDSVGNTITTSRYRGSAWQEDLAVAPMPALTGGGFRALNAAGAVFMRSVQGVAWYGPTTVVGSASQTSAPLVISGYTGVFHSGRIYWLEVSFSASLVTYRLKSATPLLADVQTVTSVSLASDISTGSFTSDSYGGANQLGTSDSLIALARIVGATSGAFDIAVRLPFSGVGTIGNPSGVPFLSVRSIGVPVSGGSLYTRDSDGSARLITDSVATVSNPLWPTGGDWVASGPDPCVSATSDGSQASIYDRSTGVLIRNSSAPSVEAEPEIRFTVDLHPTLGVLPECVFIA